MRVSLSFDDTTNADAPLATGHSPHLLTEYLPSGGTLRGELRLLLHGRTSFLSVHGMDDSTPVMAHTKNKPAQPQP